MLTVGVGRDDPGTIGVMDEDVVHAVLERGTFAQIDGTGKQRRAGNLLCFLKHRRIVGAAAVIDDDDMRWACPSQLRQQVAKGLRRLV